MNWIDHLLIPAVKVLIVMVTMIASVPFMVLFERKWLGRIQQRPGPNRVGIGNFKLWGLTQTIVDGIKLMLKEDLIPPKADRTLFILAPILALIPAMMTMMIVPIAPPIELQVLGELRTIPLGVTEIPVGILFYFAMTSVGVYGIVLAGWSSNSKYSLLGGIRSTAQLISYELAMGLALVGILLLVGSFNLKDILSSQSEYGIASWHIWRQPVAFALFLIAGFAETNRLPFDLPEGESELGAGFHTEYSSLKWALFMMAEYLNILTFSAILTTLFLGGYQFVVPVEGLGLSTNQAAIFGVACFSFKMLLIFFLFVWIRGTLPRLRYDQLMDFGWKVMYPIGLANLMVSAVILTFQPPKTGLWLAGAGFLMIWAADRFAVEARKRTVGNAT